MRLKTYLLGMGKGLLLLLGMIIILVVKQPASNDLLNLLFNFLLGLVLLLYIAHLVYKYSLPRVWILIALITGGFTLPFLFGSIELTKKTSTKKKKKK